jgi:hypothetical protein
MSFFISFYLVSKGLRAVVFFTHDESFVGSDVSVQELDAKVFDELYGTKKFIIKPKALSSSYEFLSLLDGRCDIQLKCEKLQVPKVEPLTCPAQKPCPACEKCPAPQQCKVLPDPTTTTTTTTTTKAPTTTTTTTKPPTTTTTKTTTKITEPPRTYLPVPTTQPPPEPKCLKGGSGAYCCKNGADNPDCCENGGSGPDCCTNGGKGKYCCLNGANNPDCCENGGKGNLAN